MKFAQRFVNPVLTNELKVRMRANRTAWIITSYLSIIGGVALTFIYLITAWDNRYDPNETRILFMMLSLLQLGMVCFFTPGLTSGVISGERERQTLSVLLTTNLSATKLILGKWLFSLSFMIFLVITTIPLFGIVFLFGGISPWQVLTVFFFYLITMLAIGSFGILSSTLFRRTGIATIVTYGTVFAFTAGTVFLSVVIREIIRTQSRISGNTLSQADYFWPDLIGNLNPVVAMLTIFEEGPYMFRGLGGGMQLPFEPYWLYFIFLVLVTVFSLVYAIYLIKPVKRKLARK
jgi:ABC-type transport system involved in multi-copper enzyme maturation permease subunit